MQSVKFDFLTSSQNSQIFLAHFLPDQALISARPGRFVILVPPFAEELNRSKRMYVLLARLLAKSGFHTIHFDYSGTGDSLGEWGQFDYSDWLGNLRDVYESIDEEALEVSFVALRFGALVLADAFGQGMIRSQKCILWDPIESGDSLVRQLVRMKIAAAMTENAKKITSKEVLDLIENSGYLESGGYRINKKLLDQISDKRLINNMDCMLANSKVHWMTLNARNKDKASWLPVGFDESALETGQPVTLHMHPVQDIKFWMQQETTISPKLLQETKRVFESE